jgi:4,5-DOPA dioxygenase extradiol
MITVQTLSDLRNFGEQLPVAEKMPMLFVGHGSPMNAIEENEFSASWRKVGKELPTPQAILCISAHWETRGTFVTAMEKPKTIYDFYGFPPEMYELAYPAPGNLALAQETTKLVKKAEVQLDSEWGLDHGSWSVLSRMYPDANIPALQLSIDHFKSPEWHYQLAQDLAALRKKGVLILGSGNMVHNLRMVNWENPHTPYDWAQEANVKFKELIAAGDHKPLLDYPSLGKAAMLSVPTPEHFLPMLYILGLKEKSEKLEFFNDKAVMGSVSMTSFRVG